jgi:hypothetical protein
MGHTGGDYGVSTRMFFRPDTQVGVVSLTNSSLGARRWDAFRAIDLRVFDELGCYWSGGVTSAPVGSGLHRPCSHRVS